MTKSDLKPFYLVELRNGFKYIVAQSEKYEMTLARYGAWHDLSQYNEDLCDCNGDSSWDIVAVYGRTRYACDSLSVITCDRKLLWKRKEPKKMTLKQIQEALGYKVEIVE